MSAEVEKFDLPQVDIFGSKKKKDDRQKLGIKNDASIPAWTIGGLELKDPYEDS